MATVVNFHGKNYIEPGAYAVSVYNPTSVVNVSAFGNTIIIDTGLSKDGNMEFAGGSGIKGELAYGSKAIYEFTNYEDFLGFIGGGMVGAIAEKIFTPRDGVLGAPKLYYARAAQTTAAKITLPFSVTETVDEEQVTKTGSIILICKNEGITGNGVAENGVLKVGYSARIVAGTDDATKFKMQVFKGSFAGVDADGEPYGAKSYADAPAYLITESGEYSTLAELYDWALNDKVMRGNFKVDKIGDVTVALSATQNDVLATGGTTNYDAEGALAAVLESVAELDITFFLGTNLTPADGTNSAKNGKIFTHIKNTAKFQEFLVIPGGGGEDDLFNTNEQSTGTSQAIAKYFDSEQVVVCHGAPEVTRKDGNGTKYLNPIFWAATVIGLAAGGAPQTPLTFKRSGYENFKYVLKQKEREKALQAGILHPRNVSGYFVINQGVTSLQDNKKMIANDGQSLEFSIALIKAQLNKEMILDAEQRFVGSNAAKASPETVKNFVETKLQSLTATKDTDNLIIDWKNVKTVAKNSDFFTTYDFVPNVPVNKLFFTGNILEFTV